MFWEIFYNLCKEHNIKPNPLAAKLGISSAALTKWKAGVVPKAETLQKIADYFNVSVDFLLGMEEPSEQQKQKDIDEILKIYDSLPDIKKAEFIL